MSFKVETTERKDPINQLEASKWSIKDLFRDLLNETKRVEIPNDTKSRVKKNTS